MREKKFVPPPKVTMKVVRVWDGDMFRYETRYSNGDVKSATKKEADKYARAYETNIETIVGKS